MSVKLMTSLARRGSRLPQGNALIQELVEREAEALRLVAKGLSNKQIAAALTISEYTARAHVRNLMQKLGVDNVRDSRSKGSERRSAEAFGSDRGLAREPS
jgi:DNA-binding NarL/FixJ family response regulator